ncbi:hypothetical protein ACP275_11G051800 [Erythranthe tilingii]
MDNGLLFRRLHHLHIKKLVFSIGILAAVLSLLHLFAFPYGNYLSIFPHDNVGSISSTNGSKPFSVNPNLTDSDSNLDQKIDSDHNLPSDDVGQVDTALEMKEINLNLVSIFEPEKPVLVLPKNLSLVHDKEPKIEGSDISVTPISSVLRKRGGKTMSISQMNSLLLVNSAEKKLKRPRLSSQRDRELQDAKFQILSAPIQRSISQVHASLFRNYSMFVRSYELMENKFKVYIYREGEKPIFHEPYTRGIYASEGWFMKLMEKNKQFAVKDPKKAHMFYLPFSSVKLRNALNGSDFRSQKDLENHLKKYVDIIATKYRFWNKRGGADHFLVACHDWAPRSTRKIFENCTRALCNSNIAGGFKIGKDISLPVTYIRSSENPLKDIEKNPTPNKTILAFFAGGMHGYVRPILLHYWQNKKPDMKIVGPMPRDIEGKAKYREFMKASKYCICAKGYEVHTPRVVESIYYECVPVIISDNYVPPFFEVFDWESFALFVLEKDIPNLREILLSVSEDRYVMMKRRLKMVQRYFFWHKVPEKYDLFHMILHSVWYSRVFRVL